MIAAAPVSGLLALGFPQGNVEIYKLLYRESFSFRSQLELRFYSVWSKTIKACKLSCFCHKVVIYHPSEQPFPSRVIVLTAVSHKASTSVAGKCAYSLIKSHSLTAECWWQWPALSLTQYNNNTRFCLMALIRRRQTMLLHNVEKTYTRHVITTHSI